MLLIRLRARRSVKVERLFQCFARANGFHKGLFQFSVDRLNKIFYEGQTPAHQAGIQAAGLFVSLGMALVGGTLTGQSIDFIPRL